MGKFISKPFKNFNIESRIQKEIARQVERPKAAPRHESTVDKFQQYAEDHSQTFEAQQQKNDVLLDRLRQVKVDSVGPPPEIKSARTLPESREKFKHPEYGFQEPETIPPGRCSIRQALTFLSQHQAAPEQYPAALIAREYSLDPAKVQQTLRYFQTLNMHLPTAMRQRYPQLVAKLDDYRKLDQSQIQGMLKAESTLKPDPKKS